MPGDVPRLPSLQMKVSLNEAARAAALALVYVLAARMGLELGTISGFATLVWPPTGIAIAALLLGGYRLWPGVFIGALVANVWNGAPIPVGLGIAAGNTLEALAAVYLLHRLPDFRVSLDRVRDAVGLIILAAALSPVVSATIGTGTLQIAGLIPAGQIGDHWRAWWLGDAIGALLVAPVILVWASKPTFTSAPRLLEAVALGSLVVIASIFVFIIPEQGNSGLFSQSYVFFPLLIWAAIRFGQHGAVSTTLLVSIIAVWGTAIGKGPFVDSTLHSSLFALQTYMGVTAATFLILGASTAERDRVRSDLSVAHDVAAKANRAKADFLAVMSHELRTPLNAIAGYAEILSVGVTGPLNEKQAEAVSRIQRSQEHLLSLIDDVLTFAKIEAGTSQLHPRPVRVVNAFEELDPLVQPQLTRKNMVLEHGVSDPSIHVFADPNKLRQILLNIVGNAIKFTPAGGSILLGATRDTDTVVMTVTDTGIGVPPDKLSQVFEPFFQVDTGMTREYSGVGLGLAIARDLARAMGGEIRFDSAVGEGSVVSVVLPAANAG